ncbi:MAG TPA: hypothetical protein PKL06_09665 [Chitinophagales bacterium]|jgi:hypothetical protein|nr:hypothetical protein [Chitinophagales bacterium]
MKRIFQVSFCLMFMVWAGVANAQTQPIEPDAGSDPGTNKGEGNYKPSSGWADGFVVGGNLGATFGNSTYIEVSPVFGYHITEMLIGGVGFTYQYYKENYNVINFADYSASVIGPRVFLQHELIFNFFAHAEFEHAWAKFEYEDPTLGAYQLEADALFVGLGYNSMMSENARFQIMLLYDLLNGVESIYYNPFVVRVGYLLDL